VPSVKKKRNIIDISQDWAEFITGTIEIFNKSIEVDQSKLQVVTHTQFSIGSLEGKNGLGVMQHGLKQLSKKGVHHWISSGTLIGLYRDKKLISHDTDIDVNVLMDKDNHTEIELEDFEPMRSMYYDGLVMQSAFMKDDVIFDIYYFYTGFKQGVAVNVNEYGIIEKPLRFVEKLGEYTLHHQTYPVPQNVEEFLEWRFGSDWRIPKTSKESWEKDATHLIKNSLYCQEILIKGYKNLEAIEISP